jgi:Domain of unknown function (DUF3536)/Glycosyl hydrolase family 57
VSRGRLVVHGHFYQPSRADPFGGEVPLDPSAAPAHDWTERVSAESYRPNAERGNLGHMSWDLGPTLAAWMERGDPVAYRGFIEGDRGHNGLAQSFHHTILPLASAADRRTEIRWGLRDFEWRFGRRALGLWLPEAAVDVATLRMLADAGVEHTILAPWQADDHGIDTRRPYRVGLGDGKSIVVAFYDGDLSGAVSFAPHATADADRFAQDIVEGRMSAETLPDDEPPLVVIATDGELYGHHQTFRELFLERLVQPRNVGDGLDFDVLPLAEALAETPGRPFRDVSINERTSWSCHHGVLRWTAECACVPDGRWKGPLRAALERLAAGIDVATTQAATELPGSLDPWAARDAYVDVVIGAEDAAAFAGRWLGGSTDPAATGAFLALMEAQRWRLAMFASDGWYWDEPLRPETAAVMRAAARATRLVGGPAAAGLERRLVADLALFSSPGHHLDGAEIYRRSLVEVGQPEPDVRPG